MRERSGYVRMWGFVESKSGEFEGGRVMFGCGARLSPDQGVGGRSGGGRMLCYTIYVGGLVISE